MESRVVGTGDRDLRTVIELGGRDHLVPTFTVNLFGKRLDGFNSDQGAIILFGLWIWNCGHMHKHEDGTPGNREAVQCAKDKIKELVDDYERVRRGADRLVR